MIKPLKVHIIILSILAFSCPLSAQQFDFVNNATTNGNTYGKAITIDSDGNLITCGSYTGGPNYEGTALPGSGSFNGFLAKYDSEGNILWVESCFSSSNGEALDVTTDSDNNIYVTGYFRGNSNFDGIIDSSPDEQNAYVAKYDPDGNIIWFERFGSSTRNDASAIVVDSEGSVYIGGYFQGTTEFVTSTIVSSGGSDAFLIKLDSDGNEVWIKTGNGAQYSVSRALDIDSNDNIYWVGDFHTSVDFGGATLNSGGGIDFYFAKINNDGTILSQFSEGQGGTESSRAIFIDENSNIYIAAIVSSNTNIGGIAITSSGGQESVVAKYNSSGVIQWADNIGGVGNDFATDLVVDSEGNVYVSGSFQGDLSAVSAGLNTTGASDLYISKFESDGSYDWTLTAAGDAGASESVDAMAINEFNSLLLFGTISGSVNFSGNTINSGTNNNAFIAQAFELTPTNVISGTAITDGPFNAILSGSVVSQGNSAVTESGVVWSENPTPTIGGANQVSLSSGTGSFSTIITGLTEAQTYYFRAYSINGQGTYYGNQVSFITSPYSIPIDGNQDNIPDTLQDGVGTVYNAITNNYLTVVSTQDALINDIVVSASNDPDYTYPYGQVEFKSIGSNDIVKVYYHGTSDISQLTYRKLYPNGGYRNFEPVEYTTEILNGEEVAVAILTLVDGGDGDLDGEVNGIIYDPGGPAILNVNANIPVWDWWWVLLLIGGGWYMWRRNV